MKTIYNTLTSSKEIQEFINDGGKIFITYNHVSKVSDMYDVSNIKEIRCEYTTSNSKVVTYMNKFFRFSLFQVAMPTSVVDAQGQVTIEFTEKTACSIDTVENEFKVLNEIKTIVNKALDNIDYYERCIRLERARKTIFEELNSRLRFTDKYICSLRNDDEMCEIFALENIYLDNSWYDNNEIREQLKSEKKFLEDYYSDCSNSEMDEYYINVYNKYMSYIA